MGLKKKRKNVGTSPEGFPQKAWDKLSETWRDAALVKQTEELEQEIIKAVRAMSNTTADMKADATLEALAKEYRELKASWTEAIAAEKAKLDLCVYILNGRGQLVSKDTQDAVKTAVKAAKDANEEDPE